MADFDNTELITDIRERGGLPDRDLRFTDAKLLAAASIELRDVLTTLVVESQADRQVYLAEVAVTAGIASYRLPTRAVAGRWQSVGWKGVGDTVYTRLTQASSDSYYLQSDTSRATPTSFFVRDYSLVLVPTPAAAGTLRLPYYMRPNTLVLPAACAAIVAIDGNTVSFSGTPPVGFDSNVPYDLVRGTPGFETLATNVTGTLVASTLALTTTPPSELAVGDYLCLAGQSPVAQCPVELRGLLATRTARRALKSVNEAQQAAMLDGDVSELTAVATALLSPRADAQPQEFGDPRRGLLYGLV